MGTLLELDSLTIKGFWTDPSKPMARVMPDQEMVLSITLVVDSELSKTGFSFSTNLPDGRKALFQPMSAVELIQRLQKMLDENTK